MNDQRNPGIKDFINVEILPRLRAMQEKHHQQSKLFYASAVISTLLVVVGVGVAGVALGVDSVFSAEFAAIVAVVLFFGISLHGIFHVVFVHGVRTRYIEHIVAPLLDFIRPGVEYEPGEAIGREEFDQSAIAQLPVDHFSSRGLFRQCSDDGEIRFSEVEAKSRVKPAGDTTVLRRASFAARGFFFAAQLDETLEGTTVIAPTLRRFANADQLPRAQAPEGLQAPVIRPGEDWPHLDWMPENHGAPMGSVTLPDPEFHALFDVWSTEIAEARSVLHSPFLESLKAAHSVWRSDAHRTEVTGTAGQGYFVLILRGDHLYLSRAMPRKLMEIRAFAPGDQVELLVQLARDVRLSIEVIEAFNRK